MRMFNLPSLVHVMIKERNKIESQRAIVREQGNVQKREKERDSQIERDENV